MVTSKLMPKKLSPTGHLRTTHLSNFSHKQLTAQECVAVGGLDLEHAPHDLQNGHIKRATT